MKLYVFYRKKNQHNSRKMYGTQKELLKSHDCKCEVLLYNDDYSDS
jgi:hypothetical protein